jgi:CheY-like chemotaxis protein
MRHDDDDMLFDDDAPSRGAAAGPVPWDILVVDDEKSVHQVTELVMGDFTFDGRPMRFTHCYSAAEARAVLGQPNQFALILLDVVMESEHAGLDLVRHIREELGNTTARIVLRTGQPGQAPQSYVLKTYDINDYREKTDLTHAKLSTVFYSALRAYRDLMRLERARSGLRRSIDAITNVCDSDNLRSFCSAVLEQASALLGHDGEGLCASRVNAYAAARQGENLKVLAVTPAYAGLQADETLDHLPVPVRHAFIRCMRERRDHHGDCWYACYYRTREGNESLLYMAFSDPIGDDERELLAMFSANVASTYEKLVQREECAATQDAIVGILGEALERRSPVPGNHVERVGEIAAMLARASDLPPLLVRQLRQAAPLHDVGHSGVPDAVLNTPGPLSEEQWVRMRSHCQIGRDMLCRSKLPVLQLAATIAYEHHERWDGGGYPRGLAGERISMAGRIAALADFVDAMVSHRCYRPAWPLQHVLEQVRLESGHRFDPALAERLLSGADALRALYARLPPG